MPWRNEKDPYKIWLSEVILQQTRVEQGLSYYENFLRHFPNIRALADAEDAKVFKIWEGLGYYSRCRNLLAAARSITNKANGKFPDTYAGILSLKGVGPYTASAIASFAYNQPYAVVDGNVFRVLSRFFGISTPIDSSEGKKQFAALAQQLLDKKSPGQYNQAIMDFGATVCKPAAPLCGQCVLNKKCVAFINNEVTKFPVKEKRSTIKNRWFYFIIINYKNKIGIKERVEKDIWRHLFEFPLIEAKQEMSTEAILEVAVEQELVHPNDTIKNISRVYRQKLTHQHIQSVFIYIHTKTKPPQQSKFLWITKAELSRFAFPKTINDFLKESELF